MQLMTRARLDVEFLLKFKPVIKMLFPKSSSIFLRELYKCYVRPLISFFTENYTSAVSIV